MASYKRVVLTERNNTVSEKNDMKQNVSSNAVKKQINSFDNSYTSKKLDELYNEFDAITFNSPSISNTTISQVNAYVESKSEVSFRTKLYLTSAVLVAVLMLFLAIYNIFVINELNSGIKLLQEKVSVVQVEQSNAYSYYTNELNDANKILNRVVKEGYEEISSNSVVELPLIEVKQVANQNVTSNWFNDLCNFVAGLFGG